MDLTDIGSFICPITRSIFYNPVITSDGHTYERYAIEEWFKYNNTSPNTNKKLDNLVLIPNIVLRQSIIEYKEKITRNKKQLDDAIVALDEYYFDIGNYSESKK